MPLTDITKKVNSGLNNCRHPIPQTKSLPIIPLPMPRSDSGISSQDEHDFEQIIKVDNLSSNKANEFPTINLGQGSSSISHKYDFDSCMVDSMLLSNSIELSMNESTSIQIQKEQDNDDNECNEESSSTSGVSSQSMSDEMHDSNHSDSNHSENENLSSAISTSSDEKNDSGLDLFVPTLSRQTKRLRSENSCSSCSLPDSCDSDDTNRGGLSDNEIDENGNESENLETTPPQSKIPRFQTKSPEWCSVSNDLVPNYVKNELHTSLQEKAQKPCPEIKLPASKNILKKHPDLTPKMRAILIDWMIEVSEVHLMHRQTFYLSVNYLDEFLTLSKLPIERKNLQLLGITCLFIAAKLEEIYPPKIVDLAFLSDGACEVKDILLMEVTVLTTLQWHLHSTTALDWINLYLQQAYFPRSGNSLKAGPISSSSKSSTRKTETQSLQKSNNKHSKNTNSNTDQNSLEIPEKIDIINKYFPDEILIQMTQLSDLILLDIKANNFSERFIAAAILYHFSDKNIVQKATGFTVDQIKESITHVTKFALAVKAVGFEKKREFTGSKVNKGDWLHLQTHNNQLEVVSRVEGVFDE